MIQLARDGDGALATASMVSAGSLVAGMAERKKIDQLWETAANQLPKTAAKAPPTGGSGAGEAVDRVYGALLADERFGGRRVRIFAGGYVQISSLGAGPYQKLLRIEEDFVVQKKTGPGRAAAGVATMGANFLVTGNKRGDLYLSIVTAGGAQTLRESPPTNDGIRRGTALAMAGRTVVEQPAAASSDGAAAQRDAAPVEDRLAKAKDLLDRGLITPDEYASTRASILKDL